MTTDLNQTVKDIEAILLQEQSSKITSRADIGASQLRRKEVNTLLDELYHAQNKLRGQFSNLPDLPDERCMNWAEAILSMRNLCILVVDTTGMCANHAEVMDIADFREAQERDESRRYTPL